MPLPKQNHEMIKTAVRMLIEAVGENPDVGHFQQTPHRVAAMFDKILDANFSHIEHQRWTTFPNDDPEYNGIIMCHHVPFYSFCAHHLLPFMGRFALGYIPGGGEILGLSKLIRIFRLGCKKPTTQEALTQEAVDAVGELLPEAEGVIAHVEAEHTCMSLRGVQAHGARTTTVAYIGAFENDIELRNQFLNEAAK